MLRLPRHLGPLLTKLPFRLPGRNDVQNLLPHLGILQDRFARTQSGPSSSKDTLTALTQNLSIPICEGGADDHPSRQLQEQGQFLARQERWQDLTQLLAKADHGRETVPNGMPTADLLAYGARADIVNTVEHALSDAAESAPAKSKDRLLIDGVMALEAQRANNRTNPFLTALIAQTHLDIGWIWRATADPASRNETHLRRSTAHFDRAAALLASIGEPREGSPFLSATHCALLAARKNVPLEVADAFARLIDLAPDNYRHMRTLGTCMLPRNSGSYSTLELEARRTAARTQDYWGAAGYAWVYFDAIALDDGACLELDLRFFLDGLKDILHTDPSQEIVNILAAYCAVALHRNTEVSAPEALAVRTEIAKAADWIVKDYLQEVHPLIWAHATEGFANNARVTSLRRFASRGQEDACRFIAGLFRDEIESGQKVIFTPDGLQLTPG